MIKFFKKKKLKNNNLELLSRTASLLIHAAKIDENYTIKEKELIKKALIELGVEISKVDQIMLDAEINEEKSNQILDFTKKIKKENKEYKIKIVETLWNIIYSNNEADIYETSLMRRLSGLLYLDDKLMGEIKKKTSEQKLK